MEEETPTEEIEKEGWLSIVIGIVKNVIGVFAEFFKFKNRQAKQKDTEDYKENQEAAHEVEIRNEAEDLVERVKEGDKREQTLDEIRNKIGS